MSIEWIVRRGSRLAIVGMAMTLALGLAEPGYGADLDRKSTGFTIVAPTAKDALSDPPAAAATNAPVAPNSGAAGLRALPQGLPNSSAPAVRSSSLDNIPPPPGPLGMKTPHGYVDPTHQKPDDYPMLPGIFGKPDNNVGMILGVVVPISPNEKKGEK